VETIGFTTSTGQRVRSTPAVADIGMVDRSGEEVAVFYDRDRPDRCIAPKNGRRLSPAKPLIKIAICVAALVFLLVFAAMAVGMNALMPRRERQAVGVGGRRAPPCDGCAAAEAGRQVMADEPPHDHPGRLPRRRPLQPGRVRALV